MHHILGLQGVARTLVVDARIPGWLGAVHKPAPGEAARRLAEAVLHSCRVGRRMGLLEAKDTY